MPGRQPPMTAEDSAVRDVDQEDTDALKALAAAAGPPPDSQKLSPADEDRIWAIADPSVNQDQLAQQLMVQGIPQQQLQNLKVIQVHPEWAATYGQPTNDAEYANQLAQMAKYPFRWVILQDIDDPDEMVQKADALDRRFQKAHTGLQQSEADGMGSTPGTYAGMPPSPQQQPPEFTPSVAEGPPPDPNAMQPPAPAPAAPPMMGGT